ncbi:baculoviral IAP repeat-containing protein 7-like isoform X2 [Ruditapes philippinarum]|uniref:baculoviral IAP repeat-containing protein 7-like isoform X2 n=1 Tax=Ruditapes philippinarum TaxID=129788 RepID=UPI00295A6C18|nr:baculoviral IAP repeat-containing protein 7-like isoform X2 [Ruditapes philippinarum]
MSDSGPNSRERQYDIIPNNLSDLEQDSVPVPESRPAHGNFTTSLHHANIGDSYSQRHPLVTGHSSLSRQNVSVFTKSNNDIVPDISNIYDGYKSEAKRLETFDDWPSNMVVSKEDLARNGFIYLHVSDRAQCVYCRGVLSNWEVGDIVENEHKRHCPECPFAFGYECGNIPLHSSVITLQRQNASSSPSYSQSFNTTVKVPVGAYNNPYHGDLPSPHGSFLNRIDSRPGELNSLGSNLASLPARPSLGGQPGTGAVTTNEPKYRDWGDEYKRVRSFKGWPTQMSQTPTELSKAGLLYMGNGDRCKCFWCGGELYDWEPQDIPWEEHAKWFPHCGFVRGVKGDAYIQYVRDRQNGLTVDPPVDEVLKSPHVLSVLQEGYTQEQVREAFSRFGRGRLIDARGIKQAIEQTKREREALIQASNNMAGTQETASPVTLPDEDEEMEVEETPLPAKEQKAESKSNDSNRSPSKTVKPSTSASSSTDVETVLQENEKLKDMKLCKICMDNELCMTFLPCGHLATCEDCAQNVNECPICRKLITQRVKIFWS